MGMKNKLFLTGQKFGRLLVLSESFEKPNRWKRAWLCKCECGKIKIIKQAMLRGGQTKSCGCLQRETVSNLRATHRLIETPEYRTWAGMKSRCLNKNSFSYKNYGGRGIKVCNRWLNSFENFYADMGKKPTPQHTLDRYPNNDGNYEPTNCRWATWKQQKNNQRISSRVRFLSFNGETHTMKEWAKKLNIKYGTICVRFWKGWSMETVLTTSSLRFKKNKTKNI